MKSAFTVFLMLSILSIAVFGAFGMNHESGHGMAQGGCLAAIAQGIGRATNAQPLDSAAFHINALKDFSLAIFDASAMSGLSLMFAFFVFAILAFFSLFLFQNPHHVSNPQRLRGALPFIPQKQKLARWLAFHENSPSRF